MSMVLNILKELNNTTVYSKGGRVNLFGLPRLSSYEYNSLKTTVSRLHKKEYIEKNSTGWILTPRGKNYLKRKYDSLIQFDSPFSKSDSKNLLIMFDIPEEKKAEREWLRWHLKKFNYEMIQKSVWRGPSPLPKGFTDYLKKIGLRNHMKMLKVTKVYE